MCYISDRLGVQPGDSILLQNAPRGYPGTLWPVPDDVTVTGDVSQGPFDIVQAFLRDPVTAEATLNEALDIASTSRVLAFPYIGSNEQLLHTAGLIDLPSR